MTEQDQRERYENVPWPFYVFNGFTAWAVFLLLILIAGQYR